MLKGNEKDCICEKPKGKHRKNCDAYRLGQFLILPPDVVIQHIQVHVKAYDLGSAVIKTGYIGKLKKRKHEKSKK